MQLGHNENGITNRGRGRQKEMDTTLRSERMGNKRNGLDTLSPKRIYAHPPGETSFYPKDLRFVRFPASPHQLTQFLLWLINLFIIPSFLLIPGRPESLSPRLKQRSACLTIHLSTVLSVCEISLHVSIQSLMFCDSSFLDSPGISSPIVNIHTYFSNM